VGLCVFCVVQFSKPPNGHEVPAAQYVYFSLVTLTTLRYGDAVPMAPAPRSLAVAEALTGQLYPAMLIAGVLGRALQSRNGREAPRPFP
jgi:hypothetical protein